MEEIKTSLKNLEVNIKKYLFLCSPILLEEFLILGYEEILIKDKILEKTKITKTISLKKSFVNEKYYINLIKVKNFKLSPSLSSILS